MAEQHRAVIHFSKDEYQALERIADQRDVSVTQVVREACQHYIAASRGETVAQVLQEALQEYIRSTQPKK